MASKASKEAEPAPQGVRDYIERMLDELAELAGRSGEPQLATILRHAALEASRLEPV